jgi:extracellular elastinolytic metalloproteinase
MDKQDRTRRPSQFHFFLLFAALILIPLSTVAAGPAAFVTTEPAEGSPRDIALRYVQENWETLGLTKADVAGMVLKDEYKTRHNGITHLYFQQQLDGLEVVNALLGVNVDRQGRIVGLHSRFVPNLENAVKLRKPAIEAGEALERATSHLDLPPASGEPPRKLRWDAASAAASKEVVFSGSYVSQDEIPMKLCYFAAGKGDVRLAWSSVIRLHNNRHWYNMFIDANTGDLLKAHDWVGRFAAADPAEYRVFPLPLMSPAEGPRSLVRSPADPVASPFGWHDTDGIVGPEHTDTRGNNVRAAAGSGVRPSGGAALQFDFPLDLSEATASYAEASVTNLFYWVNTLHDLHYRYGFDEVAGNFQLNNYGNGGLAGDPVDATALVAEMVTFASPPDGTSPKMRLFVANSITALLPVKNFVTLPSAAAGPDREIPATGAVFGTLLKTNGITGQVILVKNGAIDNATHPGGPPALSGEGAGERSDACGALTNARLVRGKIALVSDGGCSVIVKARHVQKAGAIGMILIGENDKPMKPLGGWHGAGDDINIPVVGVIARYGPEIRKRSGKPSKITLSSDNDRIERDSDLDAGVLIHEYGHGVVSRLTGGPASAGCVQSAQSMGMVEGTGDFWALAFTAKPTDTAAKPRAISTYVFFQPLDGLGVRGVPYATDAQVNSHTAEDLAGLSGPMVPHGAGTIWATTLWEVYWKLVGAHGFDPNFYQGRGGNNLMLQLVMDGLKLQPCNPTLLEARDAILLADRINSGGQNQCLLWQGFARRGFGVDAVDSGDPDNLQITAGYRVPAQCGPAPEPARIPGHKNDHLHNFG